MLVDLYDELRLEEDKQFKETKLAYEFVSSDETQHQEVKKQEKRLISEARHIYSDISQT